MILPQWRISHRYLLIEAADTDSASPANHSHHFYLWAVLYHIFESGNDGLE